MPKQEVIKKAKRDARQGKSASTQAGEFVKDEIDQVRKGVHGVRSAKQAIAIGLSEARRAGVKVPPNPNKKAKSAKKVTTKRKASSESSSKRASASLKALKREPKSTVSHKSMSKQAKASAAKRGHADLSRAAKKAAHTRAMHAR